jgi:hypothetical protein
MGTLIAVIDSPTFWVLGIPALGLASVLVLKMVHICMDMRDDA